VVCSKGSILVAVVWAVALFSILGGAIYKITSSQITLARRIEDRTTAGYLAMAAYQYVKWIRDNDETSYDTLYEFRQRERQLGKGKFICRIIDENSRINLNKASEEILSRLPGLNPDVAGEIFKSSYKPFQLPEEIMLIEEVTEEMFSQCQDFITVYGAGAVNINTGSSEAFRALGMDEDLIEIIQGYRAGSDGIEATEDDVAFESTAGILNDLRSFTSLAEAQEALILSLISQRHLGVKSENLCLDIQAFWLDRPVVNYRVVMDKERVKQWEEY
jgi:DNA uptake protein ComE-like DNA-binding protein